MRTSPIAMCIVLAFGCQRPMTEPEPAKTPPSTMPAGMPVMRVGSASFHLEIGGVYERYGDHKSATDHLMQAATLAQDPAHRVLAYSALGRVKEAAGDHDGAIDALEQALAKMADASGAGPSGGPALAEPLVGSGDAGVLLQLVRLYSQKGNYDRAKSLCERGLSAALEPWQREQFYRAEMELHRKAGTLDEEISVKEKALDETAPDESVLRFLAIALAGDGMMQGPAVVGARPGPRQPTSNTLLRVYERLHRLHPDDLSVRQNVVALLQRAGRIDEAVRVAAEPPPLTPIDCEGPVAPPPVSATLRSAAEAVRIRAVSGQKERLLAETAKIATLAKQEGIPAYLTAAQLYLDQGQSERASQMFDRASRESRSREDRRQVAFARERAAERAGRAAELKAIHEQWSKSEDPCLRLAASRREQPPGMMVVGPPMPPPTFPGPRTPAVTRGEERTTVIP